MIRHFGIAQNTALKFCTNKTQHDIRYINDTDSCTIQNNKKYLLKNLRHDLNGTLFVFRNCAHKKKIRKAVSEKKVSTIQNHVLKRYKNKIWYHSMLPNITVQVVCSVQNK